MSDRSRPNSVIITLYSALNKKLNKYKFLMARQQSRKNKPFKDISFNGGRLRSNVSFLFLRNVYRKGCHW